MTEHEASAKKLRNAREEGNAGISSFATSAVGFVVAAAIVPPALEHAAIRMTALVKMSLARAADRTPSSSVAWSSLGGELLMLTAPPLLGVGAAAAVVSGTQAGGVLAFKKLFAFKLDIGKGFKSLVSPTRAFGVVRSFLVAVAVSVLVYRALREQAPAIAATAGRLEYVAPLAIATVKSIVWNVAILGAGIGVLDAVITRLHWRKSLRMKDDEMKREHRESDGDPEIKHARKRAHEEMLKAVAINNVRNANVVLVNPTHVACALRYQDDEDDAPVLLSSGEGELAEAIKRAAYDYGVPVVQNVPLARALLELPVGEAIPEELYEAVAEILKEISEADA